MDERGGESIGVREEKRDRRGEQCREGEREEGGKGKMEGQTVLGEVPSSSHDHFKMRVFFLVS